jgi:hypothetical protein
MGIEEGARMLWIYLGTVVALIGASIGSVIWLRGFMRQVPRIDAAADLEAYKDLVRKQMYLTVGALPLMLGSIVLGFWLVLTEGFLYLLLVLAGSGAMALVAKLGKGAELRARSLPVAEELREEYRAVGDAWVNRVLPDF